MTEHTPNLPALIARLPGDSTRAPQTQFTRERQVAFLDNLSLTGSVRSAASAAGVSHQTAYRARRSQAGFRLAWDAAMLAARANADAVLAARAIDGVEEQVFYHGEVIATRTRYSDRLLLAHLARLDKLGADRATQAVAEDWDAAMERFARGEDPAPPKAPARPENPAPGPCNTRSMSPADRAPDEDGEERPSDLILWFEMSEARPEDAPPISLMGERDAVIACQTEAYLLGDEDWWRFGEDYAFFELDERGVWCAAGDEPEGVAADAARYEDEPEGIGEE